MFFEMNVKEREVIGTDVEARGGEDIALIIGFYFASMYIYFGFVLCRVELLTRCLIRTSLD